MCPDFNRINRVLSVQPGSIQDWHCDGCEDRCDRVKDPKERKCQSVEGTIKMSMWFIHLRLWWYVVYGSLGGLLRIGMTPIIFARRIALPILLWLLEVRPVKFRL